MPYVLGVDVGTTHTTAALRRQDEGDAAVLQLDAATPTLDSVLYLAEDDTVLVGRDALARTSTEPDRVARGFVARIGDPVAPLVGDRPCPPEMLLAALISWVVDRAVELEREAPDLVALTHPASWGPHRRALAEGALRQAGLPDVLLLPKPLAAAEAHAAANPVGEGDAVVVYDLGGHTLSCTVARLGPAGFTLVNRAETAEHLGGTYFDDVLTAHVLAELGRTPGDLDPFDEEVRAATAELRAACRTAKETLSTATEAIVPTPLFGPPSSVLVSRSTLEDLIGPAVHRTVDVLRQVVRRAPPAAVSLVGGSARVPLVAELVTAAGLGPVIADRDPETAIARGAALATLRLGAPVQLPEQRPDADRVAVVDDPDAPTQPPRPPVELAPLEAPRRRARWKAVSRARRRTG